MSPILVPLHLQFLQIFGDRNDSIYTYTNDSDSTTTISICNDGNKIAIGYVKEHIVVLYKKNKCSNNTQLHNKSDHTSNNRADGDDNDGQWKVQGQRVACDSGWNHISGVKIANVVK